MISQDMVDFYDPSLMFAIPRLAIVYGLLICSGGPLNVDRSHSDFPSLFLPFKNLLRKIRELLQTLEPSEVTVLEMLLCQLEEPANITTKLKEVERMLEEKEKTEEGKAQALKLQAKLNGDQETVVEKENKQQKDDSTKDKGVEPEGASLSKGDLQVRKSSSTSNRMKMAKLNSIPCKCDAVPSTSKSEPTATDGESDEEAAAIVRDIIGELVNGAVREAAPVEIDCTEPEIRVSPRRRPPVNPAVETVEIGIGTMSVTTTAAPEGSDDQLGQRTTRGNTGSSGGGGSSSSSRRQRVSSCGFLNFCLQPC